MSHLKLIHLKFGHIEFLLISRQLFHLSSEGFYKYFESTMNILTVRVGLLKYKAPGD